MHPQWQTHIECASEVGVLLCCGTKTLEFLPYRGLSGTVLRCHYLVEPF